MKKWWVVPILVASLAVVFAAENVQDELIELDKKWGEAALKGDKAAVANILADDVMVVGPLGMFTKAEALEAIEAREATTYMTSEYKVMMLGKETAVMSHRAGGEQPHGSLHVWVKRDGKWQVVANAFVPYDSSPTTEE